MLLLPVQKFIWQMDSAVAGFGAVAGVGYGGSKLDPEEFDVSWMICAWRFAETQQKEYYKGLFDFFGGISFLFM